MASIAPEFQLVIDEIEKSYVRGMFFSTVAASCVAMERMLNLARIKLHSYHPKIKKLWGKEATDSWEPNIDALQHWKYVDDPFAAELRNLYKNVRCGYLHSAFIAQPQADAIRSASAAYKLIGI